MASERTHNPEAQGFLPTSCQSLLSPCPPSRTSGEDSPGVRLGGQSMPQDHLAPSLFPFREPVRMRTEQGGHLTQSWPLNSRAH